MASSFVATTIMGFFGEDSLKGASSPLMTSKEWIGHCRLSRWYNQNEQEPLRST